MKINIAKDYTGFPGARFKKDGNFSGEEFKEIFLEKLFKDENDSSKIEINLDGTSGFATSFLEEAFGGLARDFGKEKVLNRLIFTSEEEPYLKEEIKDYIENSDKK